MIEKNSMVLTILLALSIGLTSCTDKPSNASVNVIDFSFQPGSITVAAGTTVVWTNDDSAPHTITADHGSFNSTTMNSGSKFEHAFPQTGTYSYHCAIHPSMTGKIIVVDTMQDPPIHRVALMPVADGLTAPMGFVSAGDERMFILDQIGLIRIMKPNGTVVDEPFLDIRDRIVQLSPRYDERGLLGLAFHPNFAEKGRLYVLYSAPLRSGAPEGWNCANRVSEFMVYEDNPDQVNMSSERILLEIDKPQMNHNGGSIVFGPDGYLYIPLGDGGGANDVGLGHAPDGNGQNTSTLLGKILRIDVDSQGDDMPYGIPADNPFLGKEGFLPEIWAYGFRNPWMITFDKGGDHGLYVSDAGQNMWEEVDLVVRGGNYGWNIREGAHCFDPGNPINSPDICEDNGSLGETLIDPIIEYGHDLGTVIVGGYIYRGKAITELEGNYIFADWSKDFTKGDGTLLVATPSSDGLWRWQELRIADTSSGRINSFIRSFGQDDEGEIYILTSNEMGPVNQTGRIFKIIPA